MYITFDGPEATGKSTQAKKLKEHLESKGIPVLLTREPGSTHNVTCVEIRKILLDPAYDPCERTALLLFLADRAQHLTMVVQPALDEGRTVISDRSSLSTLVYYMAAQPQNWLSDLDTHDLPGLLNFAQFIVPDLGFVARADEDWAIKTMKGADRIEAKGKEFHSKVHYYFNNLHEAPTILAMQPFWPRRTAPLPIIPEKTEEEVTQFIIETEERERTNNDSSRTSKKYRPL